MTLPDYIIMGAGGAGRTIAGTCPELEERIAFLDDHVTEQQVNGLPVLGPLARRLDYPNAAFIIGFGNRYQRERQSLFQRMRAEGLRFFNAVSSFAYIDTNANLGTGILVAAQCAILPNATISDNCNLCVACTLDHDAILGRGVYLSPGVNLAGGVVVEDGVFIGTNAAVVPGVHIGAWATIGAGAVVLNDVGPDQIVVGVPARPIQRKEKG